MTPPPPPPPEVAAAFAALPDEVRPVLDRLRALIFRVAAAKGAGPVAEGLSWGQPAYRAPKGATLRLGRAKTGEAALFVTCTTSLIDDFRPAAPPGVRFEGKRAVLLDPSDRVDEAALALLIARALSYHRKGM
ncbi:MAG: DUF1801 domain-containing protein [Maritimibacter sp.]|nr:DUF1801 domain-containing protein [Maritimibacter sp.]